MRRARKDEEFDLATKDLIEVDELADELGPNLIAELHEKCRTHRARDPERFDRLWELARGAVPDWLTLDDATLSACIEWLNTNILSLGGLASTIGRHAAIGAFTPKRPEPKSADGVKGTSLDDDAYLD